MFYLFFIPILLCVGMYVYGCVLKIKVILNDFKAVNVVYFHRSMNLTAYFNFKLRLNMLSIGEPTHLCGACQFRQANTISQLGN